MGTNTQSLTTHHLHSSTPATLNQHSPPPPGIHLQNPPPRIHLQNPPPKIHLQNPPPRIHLQNPPPRIHLLLHLHHTLAILCSTPMNAFIVISKALLENLDSSRTTPASTESGKFAAQNVPMFLKRRWTWITTDVAFSKSAIKMTKCSIEIIKWKINAVQKFLKKDADLRQSGLDVNAYGRVQGLLIEMNSSSCYDFVDQFCSHVSNKLMNKQSECPDDCREEAVCSSLMFVAAIFSDLPELCDLTSLFNERYGISTIDCYANMEIDHRLTLTTLPSKDMKLELIQDIAAESGLDWNAKNLAQNLFKYTVYGQQEYYENPGENNDPKMMDADYDREGSEHKKADGLAVPHQDYPVVNEAESKPKSKPQSEEEEHMDKLLLVFHYSRKKKPSSVSDTDKSESIPLELDINKSDRNGLQTRSSFHHLELSQVDASKGYDRNCSSLPPEALDSNGQHPSKDMKLELMQDIAGLEWNAKKLEQNLLKHPCYRQEYNACEKNDLEMMDVDYDIEGWELIRRADDLLAVRGDAPVVYETLKLSAPLAAGLGFSPSFPHTEPSQAVASQGYDCNFCSLPPEALNTNGQQLVHLKFHDRENFT